MSSTLKNGFAALKAVEFLFLDFTPQAQEDLSLPKSKLRLNEQGPALVYAVLAGVTALLLSLMAVILLLLLPRRRAIRRLELAEQRYRTMFENAV